jgi:DNA-binding Lrp family transcriptional regulator
MRGDKRERILRVLLNNKEKERLSKNELSKLAGCTRQWIIKFLRELQLKKLAKGTEIINKKEAVKYWIKISKKQENYKSYMVKEPLKLLEKTDLEYALTTYQAENLVQHYLFPSRIDIYVKKEDGGEWHSLMTKNGLYGNGNVRIIFSDEHVMYAKRKIKNLSVVSIPQLIVDLANEGGPCQEASEMLIKKI